MVPLRVTVVCTANRFRSPVVAAELRRLWAGRAVHVDSMASEGPSGQPPIDRAAAAALADHGLDLAAHRSTAITDGALADRDLVLCFEAHHLATAIARGGAPRARTVLVRELEHTLAPLREPFAGDDGEQLERARHQIILVGGAGHRSVFDTRLQFADPMAGPRRRHRRAVGDLVAVARAVAERLLPTA